MARKTSQTSATKRTPKAESAAKGRPPAGLPDEPDAAGVHHGDESGALPAGDGKRRGAAREFPGDLAPGAEDERAWPLRPPNRLLARRPLPVHQLRRTAGIHPGAGHGLQRGQGAAPQPRRQRPRRQSLRQPGRSRRAPTGSPPRRPRPARAARRAGRARTRAPACRSCPGGRRRAGWSSRCATARWSRSRRRCPARSSSATAAAPPVQAVRPHSHTCAPS